MSELPGIVRDLQGRPTIWEEDKEEPVELPEKPTAAQVASAVESFGYQTGEGLDALADELRRTRRDLDKLWDAHRAHAHQVGGVWTSKPEQAVCLPHPFCAASRRSLSPTRSTPCGPPARPP